MPKPSSPIPAGQTETAFQQTTEDKEVLISGINQVFGLLRVNYHNQFLKAYPDLETLNQGKRLWMKLLGQYPPNRIIWAAEQAIKASEYLPSVAEIHKRLESSLPEALGLPKVHAAYVEACRAPSPKASFQWSHPAVYWAGRASDWYFLSSQPERFSFPVFEENYRQLCQRVAQGESLSDPVMKQLPETASECSLSGKENKQHLKSLRSSLKL